MDTKISIVNWIFFTLYIQFSWSASIYTNLNLPKSNIDSLCSQQTETRMVSEGKESSLTLDLHPGLMTHGFCKRTLIAPESHGFFVRLVHTKGGKIQSSGSSAKNLRGMVSKANNSTNSCPLSIYTSNEQSKTPWRVDPCQLDYGEEQVKLFPGRLKVIWDHGGNIPNSKLIITVVGKEHPCHQRNKYPCLRFGTEPLLCISKDLVCDGVRHCPKGASFDSDEDPEICSRHKKDETDNDFWEKLTMELFRNFLTTEPQTTTTKVTIKPENKNEGEKRVLEVTEPVPNKGNVTRGSTIGGDLSKYGPWGYLMLGMLLCGGALLICGLWECCCRQNKSSDTNIAGSTLPPRSTDGEAVTPSATPSDTRPPNYDELDPPPSYSALFPNQKATNNASIESNDINTSSDSNQIASS